MRSIILYSCAAVSHALLDFLMTASTGVALCWPFTDHRYRLSLPNPIDYTWDNASLGGAAIDLLRNQAVIQEIAESFPALEDLSKLEVENGIVGGLKSGKQSMLHAIREYERERVDRGTLFQAWLNRMQRQYEELLTKL